MRFRDFIREISPPWLKRYWGERYLYAPGLMVDAVAQWMLEGVRARFPQRGTPTALAPIGRDRRIVRGFAESETAYQARLLTWLESWRIAGNPVALLDNIAGYLAPYAVRIRTVSNRGTWFTREPDGLIEVHAKQANWDWDDEPDLWSRFWVIIYPLASGVFVEHPSWGDPALWGGTWGPEPSATWGCSATVEQVAAIRGLVQTWKPAGTLCKHIIVSFDDALFEPEGANVEVDGFLGLPAKVSGGAYVPSRPRGAVYWKGSL